MAATNARYDIFLSYSSLDNAAVEQVADILRAEGVRPFLDRWYLPAGQPWQSVLERAKVVENLFLKLVKTSDGLTTRQRIPLGDLITLEREAVAKLTQERLLVTSSDPSSHQETVELAHEALIRRWQTLNRWLEQNRDFLAWRARISVVASAWEKHRGKAWLLRGRAIAEARRWLVVKQAAVGQALQAFIAASIRARRRRWLYATLGVISVSVLAFWVSPNLVTVNVYFPEEKTQAGNDAVVGIETTAKLRINLLQIMPGSFDMGGALRRVTIPRTFLIESHEVTFNAYDLFARATDRALPDDHGWGRGERPVVNVSWEDANAYADWLSRQTGRVFRLPTEAEWEYAARAGTTTRYWWGDDPRAQQQVWANCQGCGSQWDGSTTAPSGSFAANPWGLYDILGNVWEWVADCWHESLDDVPVDGSSWQEKDGRDCQSHVIRGGSWRDPAERTDLNARRGWPEGTERGQTEGWSEMVGFRVVSELP